MYREQVIVNTPYISFINDDPTKEVKLTWYYGISYQYYSMGSDGYYNAANAESKSAKGEATRWGSAVGLKGNADYFRAEYITFENSFNRYMTDEEIADGVEPSGSQSITFQRKKGVDVTSKTATERAAAIAVEGDYSEFYKCTFLGSQDTLFTKCEHGYFRDCHIEGNTDYIFGQGDVIFQDCELEFAGYSDKVVGGYIT
ncbi:MAG: pectinesterase family protein, partial [Ruminococcus sp.]